MNELIHIGTYWHINWLALITALVLLAFWWYNRTGSPVRKQILFLSGVFLMLLVTFSPVSYLGMNYLFSAHMVVHIVLLLIVPPLLLAGTGEKVFLKLKNSRFKSVGNILFSTPVAWITGIGTMYLWHIPVIFKAAMENQTIHVIRFLSLILAGLIFIWPVYAPVNWKRLSPLQCALYLFTACVGCTVLGIFITFAPAGIYQPFFSGSNVAIWDIIHNAWGITTATDQQAGGLIMWVPACFIYVTNILIMLGGYFNHPDDKAEYNNTIVYESKARYNNQ
ncbi:cytochrome c oxidase assembly protein [Saccharicrinis sp. FJH54]|uniref:cytochrome c oxidase assembly protein n=1 Tax=Saccharicrinis sp. FJH54 TaxID=3344665 RepID=UPI0035D48530